MKKIKSVDSKNSKELARLFGLDPSDAVEMDLRSDINDKIIEVVKDRELTHAQVAMLAKTSRTRVTALMNRNSQDISTDLMLRILFVLGIETRVSFRKVA